MIINKLSLVGKGNRGVNFLKHVKMSKAVLNSIIVYGQNNISNQTENFPSPEQKTDMTNILNENL